MIHVDFFSLTLNYSIFILDCVECDGGNDDDDDDDRRCCLLVFYYLFVNLIKKYCVMRLLEFF